ncbi:ank5 [Bracoviriform congregatae]|uniref:Ank5 protein n=1 Tax=Bracoviriform congregatae TaxID=39640 RepID=Q5ZNW2_9VIRU|nr:ank5 [Bracoviriform congregatae]CAG17492.1 ank5 [Bracoviriform congregatae]
MGSNKFLQMLSNKSCSGENYFHEACKAHSLMMTERNYNGEQCTHFIAKDDVFRRETSSGADINGQESLSGFTPLHLCVWERYYELAEWLCKRPDINLKATNYAGQTVYQLAEEQNDVILKEMLKAAGAKYEPSNVRRSVRSAKRKCSE